MFWEQFSQEEWRDFEEMVYTRINEELEATIGDMSKENFHADFVDSLVADFQEEWMDLGWISEDDESNIVASIHLKNEIFELIESYVYSFFMGVSTVPMRYTVSDIGTGMGKERTIDIERKLDILHAAPQPKQRTAEWYEFRNKILTASNIWKIFGTDSEYNQLIFEKCQMKRERSNSEGDGELDVSNHSLEVSYTNTASPMHWGVKYEPVTMMMYEYKHNVKVGEFGCIVHPTHHCIGASPDGIVVFPKDSPKYGRMIEIKNIVNREITGSPSEAYWTQMQIQMEVCDLDVCDFLETRFKEYENEEAFYNDEEPRIRGVILYFLTLGGTDSTPHYRYMPLDTPITKDAVQDWVHRVRTEESESAVKRVLYETLYWYLDEYSCTTVERNRLWVEWAIPHICDTWDLILKERVDGFEHRAAKRRTPMTGDGSPKKRNAQNQSDSSNIQVLHSLESTTQYIRNFPSTQNICLIKLDENGNVCSM